SPKGLTPLLGPGFPTPSLDLHAAFPHRARWHGARCRQATASSPQYVDEAACCDLLVFRDERYLLTQVVAVHDGCTHNDSVVNVQARREAFRDQLIQWVDDTVRSGRRVGKYRRQVDGDSSPGVQEPDFRQHHRWNDDPGVRVLECVPGSLAQTGCGFQ